MRRCSGPMRRRRIRMLMLMLMLRTHMEMTLCLRQCYHRSRRLARCNQASWLLSDGRAGVGAATTAQCPRHRRRHHHHIHHYRSRLVRCCWTRQVWVLRHRRRRPARCRQRPSTSAGVTAVAVAEAAPAAPRLQLQWPCLRRRRRQRRPVPAAGGGRGCAADPLPQPVVPATPLGKVPAASSRGTRCASPSSSAGGRSGVRTARGPETTDRCEKIAPCLP